MNSAAEVLSDVAHVPASVEYAHPQKVSRVQVSTPWSDGATSPRSVTIDVRRILNVAVAVIAVIVCAPLMMLIAVAVKLSSPGPIIYRQTRVGIDRRSGQDRVWQGRRMVDYGGRLFTIYKFRTMTAVDKEVQVWAKPGDARITAVGSILRKYRLDELPQLLNVLKGDMNVVGPRPEQPKIFLSLREEVESYGQRQRVLPGITGWAQVNQSYDTSLDDVRRKVRYDLEYIGRQSALHDAFILLRTLPVVVFRKGAL